MLRNLAERALEGLGVKDTAAFLQGEMLQAVRRDRGERRRRTRTARRLALGAFASALDQYE